MLKFLIRTIIQDGENASDPAVRRAYGTLCGIYGIVLNVLLFIGKYAAGTVSGSVAVTADAFNNLSDAGSSVITLLGFVLSGKKPDKDHPYGHGRIEYLTGLAVAVLIILMGFELAKSSFGKILHPQPVEAGLLPAIILIISILVKLYMALYNRSIGQKIHSAAMEATAADSLSDAVATSVVLMAMILAGFLEINVDGIAGLAVSAFILYTGVTSIRDTLSPLLGQVPDPELVQQIQAIVTAHPEVLGIHDLMVHDYGPGRVMISLHAEVPGSGDIFALHDAIDSAENELQEQLGCHAVIHMDPIQSDDCQIMDMRRRLSDLLKTELCPDITIHDFRMVPGPTHTNLIFDAVVPVDYETDDDATEEAIRSIVHTAWPDHFAVVTVDRAYTAQ